MVVLVGINELSRRFAMDLEYRVEPVESADYTRELMRQAFQDLPKPYRPGSSLRRTELWQTLRIAKVIVMVRAGLDTHVQDQHGANLAEWRRRRKSASLVHAAVPDLTSALDEYRHRLGSLISIARAQRARIILMTQPTIWRADLTPDLDDLLWMGGIGDFQGSGGRGYYTPAALESAMGEFNRTLLDVCRVTGADCLDLANVLVKNTSTFYDNVHLNESGAAATARTVAEYLIDRGILPANANPVSIR
jgi:hypothetical protein